MGREKNSDWAKFAHNISLLSTSGRSKHNTRSDEHCENQALATGSLLVYIFSKNVKNTRLHHWRSATNKAQIDSGRTVIATHA